MNLPHSIIIGKGEVGNALTQILSKKYQVFTKDIEDSDIPPNPQVMHVCINYHALGHDKFLGIVNGYISQYRPRIIDVCSTVRPGTTSNFGKRAVHSTTRGLHPNLSEGLLKVAKHIGGEFAPELAAYYQTVGIQAVCHRKPETTEVAHIAHLLDYGLQIMSADMREKLCRSAGVDYMESVVHYTQTHNIGFKALDMPSKVRMNLFPSGGKIGGHCVVEAAKLTKEYGFEHPLVDILEKCNEPI